ncbi:helix-turn-helix transcriptional regulator [Flaviflexus huanghaiensis]|uniref:helix-turn-helix transcriptional regulator n=1 Tax=Flaviflexus huanghaiensis TaxID=1111473 RepID=UPI001F504FD2|nr:WYL domain-containing protein [Flaviflexus huanghaiensis]
MAKPDVVLLTSMAAFIINTRQTTVGEIADVFDLSLTNTVDALKTLMLTEVESRPGFYFIEIAVDTEDDDDDSDLVFARDNWVTYTPTKYDDPLVYLTLGEAAVSIGMIDQVLKLLHPGSDAAESLRTVREKIRSATGGTVGAEPPVPDSSQDVLDCTWQALRESRRLTFDYHGPGGLTEKVTTRTVIPCAVLSETDGYLAALQDKTELRWFRLDRMSNASVGEAVSSTEANRARRTLKKNSDPKPIDGFAVTFTVKTGAAWFAESTPGAHVTSHGDRLDITVRAVSTTWVRESALKIGTDLLDINPPEVRQAVAEQARAMLEVQ